MKKLFIVHKLVPTEIVVLKNDSDKELLKRTERFIKKDYGTIHDLYIVAESKEDATNTMHNYIRSNSGVVKKGEKEIKYLFT